MKHGKIPFLLSFLALPMVLFFIFVVSPYAQAFYLALTNWTGYSPLYDFVGLENFRYLLGIGAAPDKIFWAGLRNNMILLVVVPAVTIVISLFFASMLNLSGSTKGGQIRGVTGSAFYRILFFVPQVISVAALGIMFQQVFQPSGLLNSLLRLLGVDRPAVLARRPADRAADRDRGHGLDERRLLHGLLLRRDVEHPAGADRGGGDRQGEPVLAPSCGSPCRCCGPRWWWPSSTSASPPWTRSRSCS